MLRQVHDDVVNVETFCQPDDLLLRSIRVSIFEILHDCAVEEIGILGDERYVVSEGKIQIFDVLTVNENLSLLSIVQPVNKVED